MNRALPYAGPMPAAHSPSPSWKETAGLMLRRRRILLTTFLAGSAVFVTVAMLKPPTYTAMATLVVRPNVAFTPVSDDAGTAIVSRDTDFRRLEPEVNATVAMLESPSLMARALALLDGDDGQDDEKSTGLLAPVARVVKRVTGYPGRLYRRFHDVPVIDAVALRVELARAALRVEPVEKSNLIEVSFTGERPEQVAGTVNALLAAYMSPRGVTPVSTDALRFFEEQRGLLAERSTAAKGELRWFLTREGSDLPFEQEDDVRRVWLDLVTRRTVTDAELAEATSRLEVLTVEVEALPGSFPIAGQVEQSDTVRVLKSKLAELELMRSSMLAQWAPNSAFVRDVDRQIERAKQLLAAEKQATRSALGSGGAAMQDLTLQLVDARTQKSQLGSRQQALDGEISAYAAKLDRLDQLAPEHRRLKARASTMEDAYITYLKKEEEARFSNALYAASIMNVEIAENAALPVRPDPTGKTLIALLGVIVSFGVALAAAAIRDRLDPALSTAAEVEVLSGLPSVGGAWAEIELQHLAIEAPSGLRLIGRSGTPTRQYGA